MALGSWTLPSNVQRYELNLVCYLRDTPVRRAYPEENNGFVNRTRIIREAGKGGSQLNSEEGGDWGNVEWATRHSLCTSGAKEQKRE